MQTSQPSAEEKINLLARHLEHLNARVALLEARLGQTATTVAPLLSQQPEPEDDSKLSDEVINWASKASLFQRLATLCFLLVIALSIRTVTENELIPMLAGSALGIFYAAVLMVAGWYLYRRRNLMAPVSSATGAVLMALIVVETHTRFQSLPLIPAYLTLMATGMGMAFISRQLSVFLPVSIGTLCMCLAGAAIDYPEPFFPYLSMILLTANVLGCYAATLKRCSWLRWIVLIVSLGMIQLWGVRLGFALFQQKQPSMALAPEWFLPVVGIFALTFTGIALTGIIRSGTERPSRFDCTLPTVSAASLYLIAHYVVGAFKLSLPALGTTGLGMALLHVSVVYWLTEHRRSGATGTNSLMSAIAVLLALSLPDIAGSTILPLPFLAGAAFAMTILARRWESGGVRFTSYLLQTYCALALTTTAINVQPGRPAIVAAVIASVLAVVGWLHYRWSRNHRTPEASIFFSRFDRHDLAAVSLVLSSLAGAFIALRSVLGQSLAQFTGNTVHAFNCGQSVIINVAALGLGLYATQSRNRELRNVAILVLVAGAFKVFLHDLLHARGVPLVVSVFTFGVAAAVQSIILSRWSRRETVTSA